MVIIDRDGREHSEICECIQCLDLRNYARRSAEQAEMLKGLENILVKQEKKPSKKQCIDWFAGMLSSGLPGEDYTGRLVGQFAIYIYDLAEAMYDESFKRYGE
jgi:hypothetical protein